MARRVVNRPQHKGAAESAEAASGEAARGAKARVPPRADPAFRPLTLNASLLNTYFSWCPAEAMPEVAPLSRDPAVSGRLTLQLHRFGGLGSLWDLVGEVGWLAMEAAWIETDPPEQYLLCAALTFRGDNPGRVIEPGQLWRLMQPSYRPYFERTSDAAELSEPVRLAVDATLAAHLAASVKPWIERVTTENKSRLECELNALLERVEELDGTRRSMRRLRQRDREEAISDARREIVAAEERIAALGRELAHAAPPPPAAQRKRLCDIRWLVKGPEPREDAFGFPV
jgi:hypothetical protein